MTDSRSFSALGIDPASTSSSSSYSSFWHPSVRSAQDEDSTLDYTPGVATGLESMPPTSPRNNDYHIPVKRWSNDVRPHLLSRTTSPRSTPPASPRLSATASPSFSIPNSPAPSLVDETTTRLRQYSVNTAVTVARRLTMLSTYTTPIRKSTRFVLSLDSSLPAHFVSAVLSVISNKYLLRGYFPFPWFLISLQMSCATIAMMAARALGLHSPRVSRLTPAEERTVKLCAFLFSCEQLTSILGLRLMNVPVCDLQYQRSCPARNS